MESVSVPNTQQGTSTVTTILIWILRLVAAVILLQTLFFKFTGAPESVYIFTKVGSGIGLNFMEPWGRIGSGVMELVASIHTGAGFQLAGIRACHGDGCRRNRFSPDHSGD